jgi:hypothetical protein
MLESLSPRRRSLLLLEVVDVCKKLLSLHYPLPYTFIIGCSLCLGEIVFYAASCYVYTAAVVGTFTTYPTLGVATAPAQICPSEARGRVPAIHGLVKTHSVLRASYSYSMATTSG